MNGENIEKGSFWNKVRSSTKQITSSLGNLSIRSEHDGDSTDSTLIHKALVQYYTNEGHGYPEWLGVPEEKQNMQPSNQHQSSNQFQPRQQYQHQQYQPPRQQQPQQNFQQEYQQQSSQQSTTENSNMNRFRSRRGMGASNSFKDIYNNSPQQTSAPPSHTNHQFQQPHNDSSALMRDRLKRNNYRNNFNV